VTTSFCWQVGLINLPWRRAWSQSRRPGKPLQSGVRERRYASRHRCIPLTTCAVFVCRSSWLWQGLLPTRQTTRHTCWSSSRRTTPSTDRISTRHRCQCPVCYRSYHHHWCWLYRQKCNDISGRLGRHCCRVVRAVVRVWWEEMLQTVTFSCCQPSHSVGFVCHQQQLLNCC